MKSLVETRLSPLLEEEYEDDYDLPILLSSKSYIEEPETIGGSLKKYKHKTNPLRSLVISGKHEFHIQDIPIKKKSYKK